jgi:competence protein ComGC
MKNNKYCKRESQQAHLFNANPIQLILGLCVIFGVSSISVRANDNPAQAAARVALEQKMYELDHPQTLLALSVTPSQAVVKQQPGKSVANSVWANDNPAQAAARVALEQKMYELDHPQTLPALSVTPSQAVVKQQPGKSAANVTGTVSKKVVTLRTALVPSTPVAARATGAPAAVAHHMLILMLVCFILSLLVLLVLLQHSRRVNSNQDSTSSGAYTSRANPFTLRLKTSDR